MKRCATVRLLPSVSNEVTVEVAKQCLLAPDGLRPGVAPGHAHDDIVGDAIEERLAVAGRHTGEKLLHQFLAVGDIHVGISILHCAADHRALSIILPIDSRYDIYSFHEFEFA